MAKDVSSFMAFTFRPNHDDIKLMWNQWIAMFVVKLDTKLLL